MYWWHLKPIWVSTRTDPNHPKTTINQKTCPLSSWSTVIDSCASISEKAPETLTSLLCCCVACRREMTRMQRSLHPQERAREGSEKRVRQTLQSCYKKTSEVSPSYRAMECRRVPHSKNGKHTTLRQPARRRRTPLRRPLNLTLYEPEQKIIVSKSPKEPTESSDKYQLFPSQALACYMCIKSL